MRLALLVFLSLLIFSCHDPESRSVDEVATPISALLLEEKRPVADMTFTGSVVAWKEEQLAFEVGGAVEWIAEEGVNVDGPLLNVDGEMLEPGTVLARLDSTRYELRLASAQAQLRVLQAKEVALQKEIDNVLSEQRKGAVAENEAATTEFERINRLYKQGNQSEINKIKAETEMRVTQAKVDQIDATVAAKRAELESIRAQIDQQHEMVNQAKLDLEKCELIAPFDGRIANVYLAKGKFIQAGAPAVRLVMMDPIQVEIAVAPETDRKIKRIDLFQVFPPGTDTPQKGWVWRKDTVADANTRTYKVRIMTRNQNRILDRPENEEDMSLPLVDEIITTQPIQFSNETVLGVDTRCIYEDEQGFFVYQITNVDPTDYMSDVETVLELKKIRVVPGQRVKNIVGLFIFREIIDANGLTAHIPLVTGLDDIETTTERALYLRDRWMFRPGDMVSVTLPKAGMDKGFYVPMECILKEQGKHYVFGLDSTEGETVAHKVEIELGASAGEFWQIHAEELNTYKAVAKEGTHFLVDGERIEITSVERAEP